MSDETLLQYRNTKDMFQGHLETVALLHSFFTTVYFSTVKYPVQYISGS